MIGGFLYVLTVVAALGCGLAAGALFAFSSFVMKALARLPAAQGIAAMQSINLQAPTPWFMTALFGTAAVCVALVVTSFVVGDEPYALYLLIGGGLYLVGTILLTIAYHIPRNNALAIVDPDGADAARDWARYVVRWTAWNHVRVAAALAAAAVLTAGLRVGA
ncbi:MAG: DUF1772 domain-containing protein [Acidimicrobiia bacterium]